MMRRRCCVAALLWLGLAAGAEARSLCDPPHTPDPLRLATPTADGDTGLWLLPIAEVLPRQFGTSRRLAASAQRVNFDYEPGSTDITHHNLTSAYAASGWLEVFGAWHMQTGVARDALEPGTVVAEVPFIHRSWTLARGDALIGAKWRLASQACDDPVAVAIRTMVKLPAGNADEGVSTGRPDFVVDAVVSKEIVAQHHVTALVGLIKRSDPAGVTFSDGLRWGTGIRTRLRPDQLPHQVFVTLELHGERYFRDALEFGGEAAVSSKLRGVAAQSRQPSPVNVLLGLTWHHRSGRFARAGVQFNPNQSQVAATSKVGLQFALGFHPGIAPYKIPDS